MVNIKSYLLALGQHCPTLSTFATCGDRGILKIAFIWIKILYQYLTNVTSLYSHKCDDKKYFVKFHCLRENPSTFDKNNTLEHHYKVTYYNGEPFVIFLYINYRRVNFL
jgi:hypothetical protein